MSLKIKLAIDLVICFGWAVPNSYGQSIDASLKMARHNYVLDAGSVLDVEITIESVSGKKVRIQDIEATGSKAIPIEIAPSKDNKSLFFMNLKVPAQTQPGKYTYVLTGLGADAHRLKGVTFSVQVVDEAERASSMELEDDSPQAILIEVEGLGVISKIYEAWILLYSEPNELHGVLYEIKDSSMLFSLSTSKEEYVSGSIITVYKIYYNDIRTVKIRRAKSSGEGAAIGAVAGLLAGVVIGLAEGDDILYTAETYAVISGLGLGLIGAGIGALVGSIRTKIHLNGIFENYDSNRNRLKGYSIKVLNTSHLEESIQWFYLAYPTFCASLGFCLRSYLTPPGYQSHFLFLNGSRTGSNRFIYINRNPTN